MLALVFGCQAGRSRQAAQPPLSSLPDTRPTDERCVDCHAQRAADYVRGAHFLTSGPTDVSGVQGAFDPPNNTLKTGNPAVFYVMEAREDGYYQTGFDLRHSTTAVKSARFDITVGSGRRGQSYLWWFNDHLFQLPVSYLQSAKIWINSPGYVDGKIRFGRPITPRCLECHASGVQRHGDRPNHYVRESLVTGIRCRVCHGDGAEHVRHHVEHPGLTEGRTITNPSDWTLERRLDLCALCHAGVGEPVQPPFTYAPGDRLSDALRLPAPPPGAQATIHANQVGLLRESRCFRQSGGFGCELCHDVHRPERLDLLRASAYCRDCHASVTGGAHATLNDDAAANCIDCHMPLQESRVVRFSDETARVQVRNHLIGRH